MMGRLGKREATTQSPEAVLAEVVKEMAKPHVVKSARTGSSGWSDVLVVQDDVLEGNCGTSSLPFVSEDDAATSGTCS
jgi:hypothetical protein